MKIISKPIKIIAIFECEKRPPRPYKFKWENEKGEETTVIVDRVIDVCKQKIAGIECLVYKCQSIIGNMDKRYELKYILSDCQWQLYKM